MTTDLTAASYSELRETTQAVEAEIARRENMDQADREAAFRAQLDEVRAGTRPLRDEFIPWLTPQEVETAVNRGQVPGITPDKRLRRGR